MIICEKYSEINARIVDLYFQLVHSLCGMVLGGGGGQTVLSYSGSTLYDILARVELASLPLDIVYSTAIWIYLRLQFVLYSFIQTLSPYTHTYMLHYSHILYVFTHYIMRVFIYYYIYIYIYTQYIGVYILYWVFYRKAELFHISVFSFYICAWIQAIEIPVSTLFTFWSLHYPFINFIVNHPVDPVYDIPRIIYDKI